VFRPRPAGAVAARLFFLVVWMPAPQRFLVVRLALGARFRMTGRNRPRFVIDQRRIEVGAGLGHDLLAEFGAQRLRLDLLDLAVLKVTQLERAKRDADQPVHLQVEGFQNFSYLTIFSLANADREPDIGALFTVERGLDRTIVHAGDCDAGAQFVERWLHDASLRAHAVAPQPGGRRQLEHARQPAVIGQQQQALGVDVKPPDADQPRQVLRQRRENSRPPFGVAWVVTNPRGLW